MENPEDNLEPNSGYQSPYQSFDSAQPREPVEAQATTDWNAPLQPEVPYANLADQVERPLSISGYISWMVVLALTLGITSLVATMQLMTEEQIGGDASPMDIMQVQMQGKSIVVQQEFAKAAPGAPSTQVPLSLIHI